MAVRSFTLTITSAMQLSESAIADLVDNLRLATETGDKRLDGMARVKKLRESLLEIEGLVLPGTAVLGELDGHTVTFQQYVPARKARFTRRDRCNNVSYILRSVYEYVMQHRGVDTGRSLFCSALEIVILRIEALQFPNQFYKKESTDA